MNLAKNYYIATATKEITLFYLGASMAITASFQAPEVYDWFGIQGSGVKLSAQMSGIWCQLISALMFAFRFYRGPEAEDMQKQHNSLLKSIKAEFQEYLNNPRDRENFSKVMDHPSQKEKINKHFAPVINFGETERKVVIAGLALYVIGALFQLVSAG